MSEPNLSVVPTTLAESVRYLTATKRVVKRYQRDVVALRFENTQVRRDRDVLRKVVKIETAVILSLILLTWLPI